MQNVHEYINNIDEEIIWTPIKNDDGTYTHERSNRGEVRKDKWIDLKHVYRMDGTKIDMPPGFYEASTMGNVRSVGTKKIRKLKLELSRSGYLRVSLSYFKHPDDKTKTTSLFNVHRVIRFAFLTHDVTLPYVHHRDTNRANNSLSNLVPCTQKYNVQQTLKTRKLTNKEVEKYKVDVDGQPTNVVKYKSVKDATVQCGFYVRAFLYGIHTGSVDQDGFFWKFTHPQPIKLTINELIPDSFRELLPNNPGHYIVKDDPRGVIYSARLQRFLTVINDETRKTYPHIQIRGRSYFIHELMHDYFVTSETTKLLAESGKKSVIHHLDNDGKNFDVNNLTRTTQAANVQASYDDGYRLLHIHVLQISLDTNTVVAEYVSASAAARVLKVKGGHNITNVCLGNRKQAHNAFWVRATNDNCVEYNYELGTKLITAPPKTRNTHDDNDDDDGYQPLSFNVIQINPTTNTVVAEYMSASSAGRILKLLGFGSVIGQACNGKIKTVRKCKWERATIENCAKYNYTLGTKLVVESSTNSA